jgi:hypothetical protein
LRVNGQKEKDTPMKSKLNANHHLLYRAVVIVLFLTLIVVASRQMRADTGSCGGASLTLPFTDVPSSNIFFCAIASAYFSGLTNGTTATTYSPSQTVTREQMAAFVSRTMDQSLKRGSQRAVAKKWWMPQSAKNVTLTTVGNLPQKVEFDGTDLWVTNLGSDTVMRVRASDGKVLDTWTGADGAIGIVAAMGKIFITGHTNPGKLYRIDPTLPAGAVTTLTSSLGAFPSGIAFDGSRIWTANFGGTISIVSLNPTTVTTVSTGFVQPIGMLYDGSNIWVTNSGSDDLYKLNSDGTIAQTIPVGNTPNFPVFDGANIWVPNFDSSSLTVVRVKDAQGNPLATTFVLATLTGNGLNRPHTAAFDGERILVTNFVGDSVSLWKAADLTPLGFVSVGASTIPVGACSDGLNFWIVLNSTNKLGRF